MWGEKRKRDCDSEQICTIQIKEKYFERKICKEKREREKKMGEKGRKGEREKEMGEKEIQSERVKEIQRER